MENAGATNVMQPSLTSILKTRKMQTIRRVNCQVCRVNALAIAPPAHDMCSSKRSGARLPWPGSNAARLTNSIDLVQQ